MISGAGRSQRNGATERWKEPRNFPRRHPDVRLGQSYLVAGRQATGPGHDLQLHRLERTDFAVRDHAVPLVVAHSLTHDASRRGSPKDAVVPSNYAETPGFLWSSPSSLFRRPKGLTVKLTQHGRIGNHFLPNGGISTGVWSFLPQRQTTARQHTHYMEGVGVA